MSDYSQYIVFVDESGDHGLDVVDPHYPMFVLAFCIMRKEDYVRSVVPAVHAFKLKHFGHDLVALHERDIRKDTGDFSMLRCRERKLAFVEELTGILAEAPFTLICSVIEKISFRARYRFPDNPYHLALSFGLERVHSFLRSRHDDGRTTHVLVEGRGKREDADLELEFRRICAGGNYEGRRFAFDLIFSNKKANSAGLQLADLVARPVGMSVLKPEQPNRAFAVLRRKFYASGSGRIEGWGLKRFP